MARHSASWLGWLWLLAACPSASEPEFDLSAYARLRCAHISACAPEWLDAFPGGTEQACRDTLTCTEETFFLPANDCAAGHDALCKALAMKGRPCDTQPAGEGEWCDLSGDCQPGLACDTSSGCGVCRPAVGVGEACSYASS